MLFRMPQVTSLVAKRLARSNVPTAGQDSADSDRDAEVLNILQRVLNTP